MHFSCFVWFSWATCQCHKTNQKVLLSIARSYTDTFTYFFFALKKVHDISHTGLGLENLLPQPPEFWNYMYVYLCSLKVFLKICIVYVCMCARVHVCICRDQSESLLLFLRHNTPCFLFFWLFYFMCMHAYNIQSSKWVIRKITNANKESELNIVFGLYSLRHFH